MKYYKSYKDTPENNMLNRGLNYGDGVFETILVTNMNAPLWDYHYIRLADGLIKLGIKVPNKEALFSKMLLLIGNNESYIVKLVIYRDGIKRGYSSANNNFCYHIIVNNFFKRTVCEKLAISKIKLSKQKRLAGIKHLNRLEQVLASNELINTEYDDAIMLDDNNNIIETTNKNIIFIREKTLYTPKLNNSGVYGVALRWLGNNGYKLKWKKIELNSIEKYHVMMVCNSIQGFKVITSIEERFKFTKSSSLVEEIINKWDSTIKTL